MKAKELFCVEFPGVFMKTTSPGCLLPITADEARKFLAKRPPHLPPDVVALVPVPARYTVKNLPDRLTGRLRLVSRLLRFCDVRVVTVSTHSSNLLLILFVS
jgi:hypothetical protein